MTGLVALGFAATRGGSSTNYDRGYAGMNGTFVTEGYAARTFNEVYHQDGTYWALDYCSTGGSCTSWDAGTVNPLYDGRTFSYGLARGQNENDQSSAQWTLYTG